MDTNRKTININIHIYNTFIDKVGIYKENGMRMPVWAKQVAKYTKEKKDYCIILYYKVKLSYSLTNLIR